MSENLGGYGKSLAAPFIFLIVVAFQFLSRYVELLRKNGSKTAEKVQLKAEIKLKEASLMSQFVPAKQMEKLITLPYDLLVEIAKRLKKHEDFTCFRCVSRSLHLCVEEGDFEGLRFRKKLPYLMLPPDGSSGDGNDETQRQFYSLVEGESIIGSLEIPVFKTSTKMCFESLGWLLTVEVDGSMSLIDPFSNTEIPLPHLHTFPKLDRLCYPDKRIFVTKMVLSSRPNETSDFIMMVIIGDCNHLAFWRLGDKAWNKIGDRQRCFRDVVYVGGGQFYAIRTAGVIYVINITAGPHVEFRIIIKHIPVLCVPATQGLYILKTIDGSLLGITGFRDDKFFLTNEFRVYDIDIETGKWKEIFSLGRMAVFIGRNSSFAVDATATASNGGGVIKANHIYYTDDFGLFQQIYFSSVCDWRSYFERSPYVKGGSVDIGVFNLETKSIEAIYPVEPLMRNVCPAMWITPY